MSEPMTSVPVPAAMPREGDVARYRSMVDRVNRMTDDGRLPGEPKRAPSAIDSPHNACCYREQCKSLVARALAAEAALAGERELRPMSDAPTDGTEIMVWGRANQVPAERERWLVVRYSRGWWTTSSPSMTVKAFAWLQLPPDAAAAIRAQGE